MGDLLGHIAEVVGGSENRPNAMYTVNPLTGGLADVFVFGVYDNTSAWTSLVGEVVSSPEGQALGRHFNAILDCSLSLWTSQQVVGGDG